MARCLTDLESGAILSGEFLVNLVGYAMENEIDDAINAFAKMVDQKANELAAMKRSVNIMCREAGKPPIYPDTEESARTSGVVSAIRADQFYGKSPIVAAREYLDMKGAAVPLEEIRDALEKGGFDFEAQKWTKELRLKNLGISLGKNSSIFHRLPNGTVGLIKWYPEVMKNKGATQKQQAAPNGDADKTSTPKE